MITRSRTRVNTAPAALQQRPVHEDKCDDAAAPKLLLEQLAKSVPCGADESRNNTEEEAAADGGGGGGNCLTPKGKRFRIPEIETCPPAPKKIRRMNTSPCTKLKRPPIAFFSPPDLELLLFFGIPTSQ
ncbi:hypothetical protein QQ045_017747 [Rhodiola kirilowii]